MKMVEYSFRHLCFIIDDIVNNNDTKVLDMIKNPSIGDQGQVIKSSKIHLIRKYQFHTSLQIPPIA